MERVVVVQTSYKQKATTMTEHTNPLIHDDPRDTLAFTRSVLAVLKEFYCLNDIPSREPPAGVQAELYTGLFYILQSIDDAIAHEIERWEKYKSVLSDLSRS